MDMLKELAARLDGWFVDQALEARREGMALPRPCVLILSRLRTSMCLRTLVTPLEKTDEECVLLSKAAKAPQKNGALLTQYLASGPSDRFLRLAEKYDVDLEQFV